MTTQHQPHELAPRRRVILDVASHGWVSSGHPRYSCACNGREVHRRTCHKLLSAVLSLLLLRVGRARKEFLEEDRNLLKPMLQIAKPIEQQRRRENTRFFRRNALSNNFEHGEKGNNATHNKNEAEKETPNDINIEISRATPTWSRANFVKESGALKQKLLFRCRSQGVVPQEKCQASEV